VASLRRFDRTNAVEHTSDWCIADTTKSFHPGRRKQRSQRRSRKPPKMIRHKVNWERVDQTRVVFYLSVGRNWLDISAGRVLLAAPGITVLAKTDEQNCAHLWCWTIDANGGAILSGAEVLLLLVVLV
jgi:hypothetical protein